MTSVSEADIAHLFHPYTNLARHPETGPMVITHGQGVRVFDEAGKDYIEGLAGLWCTALGWGEERLVAAAAEQMRKLPFYHLFTSKTHEPATRLAEQLAALAPVADAKVLFACSGSESNDTAIKLIWYRNNALGKPDKKKIIARERAYHGVTVPPATYFAKIQAVLRKYDVLLVADEVITGFGRTGQMFGSQTFGLQPDLMTVAKGLSSGYLPISALIVAGHVYEPIKTQAGEIGSFGHGFTYGGHPVSAAVALETLNIYAERDILGHVAQIGPVLQRGLRDLQQHPLVGEARGVGLIGAVELVADKDSRTAFDPKLAIGARVVAKAQGHGVILRAMGDAIAFAPPLIISEADIAEMLSRFRRALDEAHGELVAAGVV